MNHYLRQLKKRKSPRKLNTVKSFKNQCSGACGLSGKESNCRYRRHRLDLWSGRIPHAAEQLSLSYAPRLLSLCSEPQSCAAAPTCHNYWSPCSAGGETTIMRSPRTTTREGPRCSPQLEKSNKGPAQPEINTVFKKNQYSEEFYCPEKNAHNPF